MAHDSEMPKGVPASMTWIENPQKDKGGVIGHYSGIIVIPAIVGTKPWGDEGKVRERAPKTGEVEDCILYLNPKGSTYFAWPASFPVKDIRAFLVLDNNGDPVGTWIPTNPNVEIEAWPEGGSTHVVITPS